MAPLEEYTDVVYEGIGAGYYGIKFLLGCGFCDDNPITARLRCYTSVSRTYQFVPYACDSILFTTSLAEQVPTQIKIFPNPNSGILHIEGILQDTEYRIRDLTGRIIQEGVTVAHGIEIYNVGMSILEIKEGSNWVSRKIIRIH